MYVASKPAYFGEFIKKALLELADVYDVDRIVRYDCWA